MFAKLLKPQVDLAALFLRLGLAAIFIAHGMIKVLQDLPLRPDVMSMHMQTVVGWIELIAGSALLFGIFSRLASLALIVLQVGAIVLITGQYALRGPVVERTGADYTRVGPEFNLVLITMCLSVMVLGSGALSLDHCLRSWWGGKAPAPQATAGQAGRG
jgi:uncharacterized membrane protein YphA (DoxX/SURF4 family)